MRRRHNPDSGFSVKDAVIVGGVGLGLYTLYQLLKKLPNPKPVLDWTSKQVADAVNWWEQLTAGPPMSVPGNVVLSDGTVLGPLSDFIVKTDAAGNVYIQYNYNVYQIGQSDSNGNWPAQLVTPPNFGVTGTGW